MYVIEVIPLQKHTTAESLSYYASADYPVGTIIPVPIRKQTVQAVVIDTKPVSRAKTALRAATFSLRKLSPPESTSKLPKTLIDTAYALNTVYPSSVGTLLFALLPPDIRNGSREYPTVPDGIAHQDAMPSVFTGTRSERFLIYKSYIRQAFAHSGSVMLVVPNSATVPVARASVEQGIEKRVITFCSTHTKRQLNRAYEQFTDLSKAKLIICTPNYAFLLRHDITNIIIEESGNNHYRARTRPYLDSREVLKVHAEVTQKSILLGDVLPSTSDEIHRRNEHYLTHDEHPKRIPFLSTFAVSQHKQVAGEQEFSLFTPALKERLDLVVRNRGKAFIYAARKGLAPLVVCFDCGHIFRCPDSGAPFSLWRKQKPDGEEERWFICSTSGRREKAADVCPQCGSWRLREQGVGIQKAEDQACDLFPKATIIRFDHETASTHTKAKKLVQQFYETKKCILIGTQMVLPYLTEPVDVTAVSSFEAMRAIPSWRAEEQTLALLLNLREKTLKDCIVQTRSKPDDLLKIAKRGSIDAFYDEEIIVREQLKYPPYSIFILLTYLGTKPQVEELEMQIEQHLVGYHLQTYNTPMHKPEKVARHTLVRIPAKKWPDEHLMQRLRALPPTVKIEVNPERIV